MNLCRCENGHFYDGEKFASCPHCANGMASNNADGMTEVFSEPPMGAPMGGPVGGPMGGPDAIDSTMPLNMAQPAGAPMGAPSGGMDMQSIDATVALAPEDIIDGEDNAPEISVDDDDDHTMAFMDDLFSEVSGQKESGKEEKAGTTGAAKPASVSAPCVGWLIAVDGAHVGQDFRLISGKNFIGRGEDMDVALTGDKSVSRNRHAVLVYEPKKHLYLVQPGESSSLVYHNDDVVLNPVQLKAYDVITVGDVNLVFMPLCNDNFNWVDLLSKLKNKDNG